MGKIMFPLINQNNFFLYVYSHDEIVRCINSKGNNLFWYLHLHDAIKRGRPTSHPTLRAKLTPRTHTRTHLFDKV